MAMVGFALSAGSAVASTEVSRTTFTGAQASAAFVTSTSITCADGSGGYAVAYGYVSGAEQIYSSTSGGYTSNGIYVELDFYFNSCTGANAFGTGGIADGFTAPDKKLVSASLSGSGTVQNYNDGSLLPVSLDLQIVGTGTTNSSKSNSQSKVTATKGGPLYISSDHSANTNRSADVSGSITVDGVTFTSLQTFYGTLNANGSASVSISK
jgi:hypothetical protein